ncbi:MAG: hypothetical protein PHD91_06175 [bacterium]|jgi:hypothetical protein|nr:hypothetical protein [bacterium]MDD4153283.1 hypothetical protein [bacterium]MDD4559053.1 hypothetical protein [bacterium]
MLETTISLPEIDKEVMLLCDRGMNSFLKLDIILFYHNKRLSDADVNELARYTGRSPVEVEDAVSALIKDGLLEPSSNPNERYRLSGFPNIPRPLNKFLEAYNRLPLRLAILSKFLRENRY